MGISILHLILYLFWKDKISNLYYSLFLLLLAAAVLFDFQHMTDPGSEALFYLRLQRASLSLSLTVGQFFFFTLFATRRGFLFWLLNGLLVATGLAAVVEPVELFIYLELAIIAVLLQIIRIAYQSLQRTRKDIAIIGVGFLVFVIFGSYDMLLDAQLIRPILDLANAYQFGVIGLTFATSIYLAKDISDTNQKLLEQQKNIVQQNTIRQMLQEEVERTQKELSEARNLQLSMLPDQLPETSNLRLAARMQTAAEVGGDYYDVNENGDGTFTFVIGDATGHGNKAGFMVAIIKSLFKSYQPDSPFPDFFRKVTLILKQMNLGVLFMALSCLKIRGRTLTISIAGMPPILVYKNQTASVDEYILKGMPLGAVNNFPYKELNIELDKGDVVLAVSDGLHELSNENGEMFGWDKLIQIFGTVGHLSPDQIIDRLEREAHSWRGDKSIDDDITYLVINYTGERNPA